MSQIFHPRDASVLLTKIVTAMLVIQPPVTEVLVEGIQNIQDVIENFPMRHSSMR